MPLGCEGRDDSTGKSDERLGIVGFLLTVRACVCVSVMNCVQSTAQFNLCFPSN